MASTQAGSLPGEIRRAMDQIVGIARPQRIYLYNHRRDLEGKTSGFKLCVVAPTADKQRVERAIYLDIDCDIPFDILLYTPGEWEDLSRRDDSFAGKIARTGILIYE